jgi:hypothetical protein
VRFFRHHKPEIGFTHPALNYTLTDQEGSFNKNDIFIGYKGFLVSMTKRDYWKLESIPLLPWHEENLYQQATPRKY